MLEGVFLGGWLGQAVGENLGSRQSPFARKVPPLFLNPFYLLGIPPLRVVRFPSTLVPGCLCTDLPPSFPPHPHFPFPNGSPFQIHALLRQHYDISFT